MVDSRATATDDGPAAPARDPGGVGGWWASFVDWATRVDPSGVAGPRPVMRPTGPRLRLASLAAGALSLVMITGSVIFSILSPPPALTAQPEPSPPSPPTPQDVAADIGARADALGRTEPLTVLQLRLAAHTIDQGSAVHRSALAQLLLGPRPMVTLDADVGEVTGLAFAGTGTIAVGGRAGVQESTGQPPSMTLGPRTAGGGVSAVAYGPGGLWLATSSGPRAADSRPMTGAGEPVSALVPLGPAGWAATTGDGRLVVWDGPPAGEPSRVLADGLGPGVPLAATLDGQHVVTATDAVVAVRSASSGAITAAIDIDEGVSTLSIGGEGRWLLVGHGARASIFDIADPDSPKAGPVLVHPVTVSTVVLAPDGRTAVTSGGGVTAVWELSASADPVVVATLPVTADRTVAAYSADSATLATGAGSSVHLWSVAELVVYRPAQVQPRVKLSDRIAAEPITYAALNSDGTILVTGGGPSTPAYVWRTRDLVSDTVRLSYYRSLDGPIRSASAVGGLWQATIVVVTDSGEAVHWINTGPAMLNRGQLATAVDAAAVAPGGRYLVVVGGDTGIVFGPTPLGISTEGTLSYPAVTTALAFAPSGTTLIGGHADGSVTVHTLDIDNQRASRRLLASTAGAPVDAVALSGNAAVALATHDNGAITFWNLARTDSDRGITIPAAAGVGPHSAWLNPSGDFAAVADTDGTTTLWSFVDRQAQPVMLATLLAGGATLPVTVSADGTVALQIGPDNQVVLWDLQPVLGLAEDPTGRACQLAQLTYERWREIDPPRTVAAPCLPPEIPALDATPLPTQR